MAIAKPVLNGDVLNYDTLQTDEINVITDEINELKKNNAIYLTSFSQGWGNYNIYTGAFEQALVTRVNGVVTLGGLVSPTTGASTVILVLPEGYRPRKTQLFSCQASGGTIRVDIAPNGNVTAQSSTGFSFISLSGITFLAQG